MRLQAEAQNLLVNLDEGGFSCTAYDTAWVARLSEADPNNPMYPYALQWLCQHQHPDGSWGGEVPYFHDRIISTLSAILALTECGRRSADQSAVKRGMAYIHKHVNSLKCDPYETVGFELIFPTLLQQAHRLGLDLPYSACEHYAVIRQEKLNRIPRSMLYTRKATTAHSIEFMADNLELEYVPGLQEPNGSFGYSPSATAYILSKCPENASARSYLNDVLTAGGGAAMPAHTVEIFNKSWVLYHLDLVGLLEPLQPWAQPHLDYLRSSWNEHWGVGFARHFSVPDLDDTALVFKLLRTAGDDLNPDVFKYYEKEKHFTCYSYERNPSMSANIHLLDALRTCPEWPYRAEAVDKILRFLYSTRVENAYWYDKWHISPYYVTGHGIIATLEFDTVLAQQAVEWILATQYPDGGWGCRIKTQEETAYCVQALLLYRRQAPRSTLFGLQAALERAIHSGAEYLYAHAESNRHPGLWIEKCLYTPQAIVHSAVLSALALYEMELAPL